MTLNMDILNAIAVLIAVNIKMNNLSFGPNVTKVDVKHQQTLTSIFLP